MTAAMRQLGLCVFLFTFISAFFVRHAAFAQAAAGGQEETAIRDPAAGLGVEVDQNGVEIQVAGEYDTRPGASDFNKALDILQTVGSPRRHLARYSRPTGVLGTAAYYAREVFYLLFMNGPKLDRGSTQKLIPAMTEAVTLLEAAADQGHDGAMFELAEMNFYGLNAFPRNFTAAFEYYKILTSLEGQSAAQHMIGFMYATGIGGVVQPDQAKALLYHTFAADADVADVRAVMTVAYRHQAGIGVPKDCEKAVHYYKQVADAAMDWARSGPPGGQSIMREAYRLADDDGGVYGEGASVSSSGENAKRAGPTHDANAAFDDVLEYLDLMSRKGEVKAIFSLGRLHYDGSRVLQRNFRIAKDKFFDVARRYWDKNGKIRSDFEPGVDKWASKAAGYIGRMFLRGEGLEQNYHLARVWFQRGIENGDALSQYSMGLIHLHGLGVTADAVRAAEFFGAAADQDLSAAQVRLGALLMDQGDLPTATKYFELASRNSHIESFYYLAELALAGANGQPRNCAKAAIYYKLVAEKAEPIHSNFGEANDAYEEGDVDTALLYYMLGAEQGYEAGQANVAYLLDRSVMPTSQIVRRFPMLARLMNFRLPFLSSPPLKRHTTTSFGDAALALIYWTRSAKESNIDSMIKMGDYYLAELGTPPIPKLASGLGQSKSVDDTPEGNGRQENSTNENHAKAAACYIAATERYTSSQALFNLGWMHENGIGLAQDFHLAKRYYDQAAEPPMREARVPVALALMKLRVRSWWNWVTGGQVNGISAASLGDEANGGERGRRARRGFWDWLAEFIAADMEMYDDEHRHYAAGDIGQGGGGDEHGGGGPGGYMDEWGRTLHGDARGYGDEQGDEWEDGFGDLVETLVIVAFAAALAAMVWYRQMMILRQRTRERAQRQQMQQQMEQQQGLPVSQSQEFGQGAAAADEGAQAQEEEEARNLFQGGAAPPPYAAGGDVWDAGGPAGPGGIGH